MNDEDLLRRMGEIIDREANSEEVSDILDDPRWDRWAAGELPDNEVDALLTAGREAGVPEEICAGFRPLDASVHERIERLFEPAAAPARPPAKIIAFPTRRQWIAAAGGLAALAAAVPIYVRLSAPSEPEPLPAYAFEMEAGEQPMRGQARAPQRQPGSEPVELTPDSLISITLRPARRVASAVLVSLFVQMEAQAPVLRRRFKPSARGTFVIRGNVAELIGQRAGVFDLIFVVTRAHQIPERPGDSTSQPEFRQSVHVVAE